MDDTPRATPHACHLKMRGTGAGREAVLLLALPSSRPCILALAHAPVLLPCSLRRHRPSGVHPGRLHGSGTGGWGDGRRDAAAPLSAGGHRRVSHACRRSGRSPGAGVAAGRAGDEGGPLPPARCPGAARRAPRRGEPPVSLRSRLRAIVDFARLVGRRIVR